MHLRSLLVTLVVLILTIAMIKKWGWKPILERLRQRRQQIIDDEEAAQKAKEDSEKIRNQLETELRNATQEMEVIIQKGQELGKKEYNKLVYRGEEERKRIIEEGHKKNQAELQKMLQEFESEKFTLVSEGILTVLDSMPADVLETQTRKSLDKMEKTGYFEQGSSRHGV